MARKIADLVSGGLPGPERAVNGARADREIPQRARNPQRNLSGAFE
jgi:hypothetical protein